MGFIKFVLINKPKQDDLLKTRTYKTTINEIILSILDKAEAGYRKALETSSKNYLEPCDIEKIADLAEKVLSTGNQTGEGWLLTGEMLEFIENGIPNIVCVQPFACLPNHVVGKGVIKKIRELYQEANIAPVDYDPGASESNQINRIKLLLTVAKDNLKMQEKERKILEKENQEKTAVK